MKRSAIPVTAGCFPIEPAEYVVLGERIFANHEIRLAEQAHLSWHIGACNYQPQIFARSHISVFVRLNERRQSEESRYA